MSQEEISKVLDKLGEATAKEIAEVIKISIYAVRTALNKMERWGEVERKKLEKTEVELNGTKYSGRHYLWIVKR